MSLDAISLQTRWLSESSQWGIGTPGMTVTSTQGLSSTCASKESTTKYRNTLSSLRCQEITSEATKSHRRICSHIYPALETSIPHRRRHVNRLAYLVFSRLLLLTVLAHKTIEVPNALIRTPVKFVKIREDSYPEVMSILLK